jgi:hypothetical protein
VVNITAKSSKLLARGLPAGHSLFLRVYASNAKGRSRSVTFDGYTLHMADKHPGKLLLLLLLLMLQILHLLLLLQLQLQLLFVVVLLLMMMLILT